MDSCGVVEMEEGLNSSVLCDKVKKIFLKLKIKFQVTIIRLEMLYEAEYWKVKANTGTNFYICIFLCDLITQSLDTPFSSSRK